MKANSGNGNAGRYLTSRCPLVPNGGRNVLRNAKDRVSEIPEVVITHGFTCDDHTVSYENPSR